MTDEATNWERYQRALRVRKAFACFALMIVIMGAITRIVTALN